MSGDVTVKDPNTGQDVTVKKVDLVEEAMYGEGEMPDEETDRYIEYQLAKERERQQGESAGKMDAVAKSMGMDSMSTPGIDPAEPFQTFDINESSARPAPEPAPNEVAPGSIGSEEGAAAEARGDYWDPHTGAYGPYPYEHQGLGQALGGYGRMIGGALAYPFIKAAENPNPYPPQTKTVGDYFGIGSVKFTDAAEPENRDVTGEQRDYLDQKRRRSQIIDRKLRSEVARIKRLGL